MKTKTNTASKKLLAIATGPMINDPRIIKMRAFKEKFQLTTSNLVEMLALQGFEIKQSSLSSYLQGNVMGTDVRKYSVIGRVVKTDHLTDVFAEFLKLEAKHSQVFAKLLSTDMRKLMESWIRVLDINEISKIRKLSKIIGIHYVTLYDWYRKNQYPRSIKTILEISQKIQEHLASVSTLTTRST